MAVEHGMWRCKSEPPHHTHLDDFVQSRSLGSHERPSIFGIENWSGTEYEDAVGFVAIPTVSVKEPPSASRPFL